MGVRRVAAAGGLALALQLAACARAEAPGVGPLQFESLASRAVPAEIATHVVDAVRDRFPQGGPDRARLYRTALPDELELYVLWLNSPPLGSPSVELIVRRKADGALSPASSPWEARWEAGTDEVLQGLRVADLEGDGHWQLVYRQREHNGTMYNARTDHYLTVGSDLAFGEVLALTSWTADLWSLAEEGAITRSVKPVRPGELLLEVRTENPEYGDPGTILGRALLVRGSDSKSYEVEETQVLVARYADFVALGP